MGVCGEGKGGVEGVRIGRQNGQIHEFNQIYKVLLVCNTYTYNLKQTKFIFFKFDISIMFSCSVLTSLS